MRLRNTLRRLGIAVALAAPLGAALVAACSSPKSGADPDASGTPPELDASPGVDTSIPDGPSAPDAADGAPRDAADAAPPDADASVLDAAQGDDAAEGGDAAVPPITPLRPVALLGGGRHACALLAGGALKCWGGGTFGQLGQEEMLDRGDGAGEMGALLKETRLGAGRVAVSIATGYESTCALLQDGAVKCFGRNGSGILGNGDGLVSSLGGAAGSMGDALPVLNLGINRVAVALAGGDNHMCAIFVDGAVKCWGNNQYGQLGLGDKVNRGDGPGQMGQALPVVALGAGRRALQLAAGAFHTCAVLDNGTLKCWGRNSAGQLGQETRIDRGGAAGDMGDPLPAVKLGAGRFALEVSCGYAHTCVRLDDGTAKCWGSNASGVLGQGSAAADLGAGANELGDNLRPIALGAGRTVRQIVSAELHACALLDNGDTKCWGSNANGRLGQGDTTARGAQASQMGDALLPVRLGVGRKATLLAGTRSGFTCARLDNGDTKCWGSNSAGRLGQGDAAERGSAAAHMGDALLPVALQ